MGEATISAIATAVKKIGLAKEAQKVATDALNIRKAVAKAEKAKKAEKEKAAKAKKEADKATEIAAKAAKKKAEKWAKKMKMKTAKPSLSALEKKKATILKQISAMKAAAAKG